MVQLKKLNDYLEQELKYDSEVVNYDVKVGMYRIQMENKANSLRKVVLFVDQHWID